MVDYYKEMGIPAYSSEMDIKIHLDVLSPAQKEAVEFILLNSSRKKIYDNHHRQLKKIGRLRCETDLVGTGSWGRDKYASFTPNKTLLRKFTDTLRWVGGLFAGMLLYLGFRAFIIVAIVGIGWGILFFSTDESDSARQERLDREKKRWEQGQLEQQRQLAAYEAVHPRLALPFTGILQKIYYYADAPLEIRTRAGGPNYYIKLVTTGTEQVAMTAFIRAGQRLNTTVPLGSYELRYATGTHWYGETELFGKNTSRNRADDVFVFEKTLQGYRGHTVELFLQSHGNLGIERLSAESF